jgi:hypothetical protein
VICYLRALLIGTGADLRLSPSEREEHVNLRIYLSDRNVVDAFPKGGVL